MNSSVTSQVILLSAKSGLSGRISESQITAVFYPQCDNWICTSLPSTSPACILIQANIYAETLGFPRLVLHRKKP